jgi:hypothetical protein
MIYFLWLFLCLLFAQNAHSQSAIQPENGAKLNFIHVLFQWECVINAKYYELEVENEKTKVKWTQKVEGNSFEMRENLYWGNRYNWKVKAFGQDKKVSETQKRNFEILFHARIDSSKYRHLILTNTYKSADSLYIVLDNPGVIIDLRGNPIWFYPDTNVVRFFHLQQLENGNFATLKPQKVKAANENLILEEVSKDGKQIWLSPKSVNVATDSSEYWHHDYQKLQNGNYLIVGNNFVYRKFANGKDSFLVKFGTVIEVNSKKECVWHWLSSDYVKDEDAFYDGYKDNPIHLNSIFLDEKTDILYVSLRYIDRILAIDRKTKKVLQTWGTKMPSGEAKYANELFHHQHSAKLLGNSLFLYDNGLGTGKDTISSLAIFSKGNEKTPSKLQYRFLMNFGRRAQSWSESKGDVDRISNGLYLIEMGAIPRTVLVDTTKGIVWRSEHQSKVYTPIWMGVEENYRSDWIRDVHLFQFKMSVKPQKKGFFISLENVGKKGEFTFILKNESSQIVSSETKNVTQLYTVRTENAPVGYTMEVYFKKELVYVGRIIEGKTL